MNPSSGDDEKPIIPRSEEEIKIAVASRLSVIVPWSLLAPVLIMLTLTQVLDNVVTFPKDNNFVGGLFWLGARAAIGLIWWQGVQICWNEGMRRGFSAGIDAAKESVEYVLKQRS